MDDDPDHDAAPTADDNPDHDAAPTADDDPDHDAADYDYADDPTAADAPDHAGDDYDHADPDRAGQLHHVELYASDLDASVGFWGWLLGELGYEPKNDWPGGRSWVNGPTYVVLVAAGAGGASDASDASDVTDGADHPFDRHAPGLNHLAFHAGSREQVDRLTAGVRERADASVLYDDRHPYAGGYYALYCEDPEGIKVEVVGPEE